jgi:hypothetical protein
MMRTSDLVFAVRQLHHPQDARSKSVKSDKKCKIAKNVKKSRKNRTFNFFVVWGPPKIVKNTILRVPVRDPPLPPSPPWGSNPPMGLTQLVELVSFHNS